MYVAGIVLYNPEIPLIKQNINTLLNQNFSVLLVDNGSRKIEEIKKLERENVTLIINDKNKGIGVALNQICTYAYRKNTKWALTLDQDSIVPDNILSEYVLRINRKNIAIICPTIIEKNLNKEICIQKSKTENYVEKCITSASFINISIWKETSGFDEKLFIDYVDFDYSCKVRRLGYKILKVTSVQLIHSLGESELRRFLFWHIRVSNHSAERKYFISRNIIIYCKKYRKLKIFILETLRLVKVVLVTILYENDKKHKILSIIKGIRDGICWEIESVSLL